MEWYRAEASLSVNKKFFALCTSLGTSRTETMGILHLFFSFVARACENGILNGVQPALIAQECSYPNGESLFQSLLNSGFLVRRGRKIAVTGWMERNGRILAERERMRRKRVREQCANGARTVCDGVGTCVSELVSPLSEPKKEEKKTKKTEDYGVEILQLYEAYPRKVDKPKGLAAIARALTKASFGALLPKVKRFNELVAPFLKTHLKLIPYPATWFNGERWNDGEENWIAFAQQTESPGDSVERPWGS